MGSSQVQPERLEGMDTIPLLSPHSKDDSSTLGHHTKEVEYKVQNDMVWTPVSGKSQVYAVVIYCLTAALLFADQNLMAPNLTAIAESKVVVRLKELCKYIDRKQVVNRRLWFR